MIKLVQEFGVHAGRALTFQQPRVRLGRAPGNDVTFDANLDLDCSGQHCEVLFEGGQWFVVDLNSRNGTFVNGQRVQRQALQHGDLLECGRGGPRIRVELPGATPQLAPPMAPPTPPPGYGGGYGMPPSGPGMSPPMGPPPSAAWGAPPMPPTYAPAMPPAMPPPAMPQGSVGAAVAAQLPNEAKIGKRTVAMMIDAALQQSGTKQSNSGLKVAVGLLLVLVVVGFGVGGLVLMNQSANSDSRAGERIAAQNEGAIFLLAIERPGRRPQGFCTGFAVSPTLIATNAHCVEAAREQIGRGATIAALPNNGRGVQVAVTPVFRDPRYNNAAFGVEGSGFDVGLMRTAGPVPVTVRLATMADALAVRPGAQIYVYGFPGNTMNEASPVATITQGVLNRFTDFFDRAADPPAAQKLQHTAQTTSGSSGSPIFLSSGQVIAINAGSLVAEERTQVVDPTTGRVNTVEMSRSSNFKYGMRADLIRAAIHAAGDPDP